MANNQNLKDAISAVIKENGNNEITGQLLQSALISIVNQFGAGAVFAGVAEPSTVPINNDVVAFYIATTNGIYPNFGGYSLTNNDFVVFSNKEGVYEVVAELNVSGINYLTPIEPGTIADRAELPAMKHNQKYTFEAKPGFYKFGSNEYDLTTDKRWIFFGDSTTWSLVDMGELPKIELADEFGESTDEAATQRLVTEVKDLAETNNINLTNVVANNEILDYYPKFTLTRGKFIRVNGTIQETSEQWGATEDFLPTGQAESIHYKGEMGTFDTRMAFYSGEVAASFISSYPAENILVTDEEIPVPSGAKYYRFTSRASDEQTSINIKNFKLGFIKDTQIDDTLNSSSNDRILSAKQGKILSLRDAIWLADRTVEYTANEKSAINRLLDIKFYPRDSDVDSVYTLNRFQNVGTEIQITIYKNGSSFLSLTRDIDDNGKFRIPGLIDLTYDLSQGNLNLNTSTSNIQLSKYAVLSRREYILSLNYEITGAIVTDSYGNVVSANVEWSNGTLGTFTSTNFNASFLCYDGFVVRYNLAYNQESIVTQPPVTRNSLGVVINKPNITVN